MCADSPRALSKQRDPRRIAAKKADIVLDPPEGHQLIAEPHITIRLRLTEAEKAQRSQAVVDGDDDYALFDEALEGLVLRVAGAKEEEAAVYPEHDGEEVGGAAGSRARAPEVQYETVLRTLHSPLRCLTFKAIFPY